MRWIGLAWLCFPLLFFACASRAEPCPVDLRPADASYGYRHREGPDRCEGLYASPVAGEGLEVLSFTIGRSGALAARHGALTITAPDLHGLGAAPAPAQVSVVARALPLRVYYRMDATLPPAGSVVWPVDQVVIPAGLDPADIGLVGLVRTDQGSVYVPLRLSAGRSEAGGGAPEIVFRAPVDLESFQWRIYAPGQAATWKNKGAARAGDAIVLPLDAAAPGTITVLEVAAKPEGSSYIQSRYRIFRP